jgi:alanine racemase
MQGTLHRTQAAGSASARPAWFEIDLGALVHNYREIARMVGPQVQIFACLKGNAYGCGAAAVARALHDAGCRHFAFGNIDDALSARTAGVGGRMLLYPVCLPESAACVQQHGLAVSVGSAEEACLWNERLTAPHPAYIKIDAGALRAGVFPADAATQIAAIAACGKLQIEGAYGHVHLGRDNDIDGYMRWQADNFQRALDAAQRVGVALPTRMLSSTATLLRDARLDFNAVDPGRLLFGLGATGGTRHAALRPVLTAFKTRLVHVRDMAQAQTGGFVPPFDMRPQMRVGLLPVGWGDGLPTRLPPGSAALVRGVRAPLLAPTHLEQTRIDLTGVPGAELGDEVVLIGRQGAQSLTLGDACRAWGLEPTHFQACLGDRVDRRYVNGGD